jgi:predicted XRE-type DNA-binding protein
MTAELATFEAPRRSRISGNRPEVIDGRMEFTFANINELCAFVAKEIAFSKMKYSKFAKKADICHGTVSRMANGTTQHPRAETVFAMLRVLGYEVVVRS